DEFEHRGVGEIRNREHGLEHGLQALIRPAARGLRDLQELVIGRLLNLDEVRHLCDFLDFSEKLANALATNKSLRSSHVLSSPSNRMARTTLRSAAIQSRPSGQASGAEFTAIRTCHPNRLRRIAPRG